jgi:hypothetical protein
VIFSIADTLKLAVHSMTNATADDLQNICTDEVFREDSGGRNLRFFRLTYTYKRGLIHIK